KQLGDYGLDERGKAMSETAVSENADRSDSMRSGLGLAALSVGVLGLVLALLTWAAWLFVLPTMQEATIYSWTTLVFALVLGALWFVVILAAVLAMIFGFTAGARTAVNGGQARVGVLSGAFALAAAITGAIIFVFSLSALTDLSISPGDSGTYSSYFN